MTTKRHEIEDTCDLAPDFHISPRNLTMCMSLNSIGSHHSATVRIHLTNPKQRAFYISLSGMRLNCSPIGGIIMSAISDNGDAIRCKSLLGSYEEDLVTCPYHCECPNICSNVVAFINNKSRASLCNIGDWHTSAAMLLGIYLVNMQVKCKISSPLKYSNQLKSILRHHNKCVCVFWR